MSERSRPRRRGSRAPRSRRGRARRRRRRDPRARGRARAWTSCRPRARARDRLRRRRRAPRRPGPARPLSLTARNSPGGVRTVNAGPASRAPRQTGRIRGSIAIGTPAASASSQSAAARAPRRVDPTTTAVVASSAVPYTLAEKILLAHTDADEVAPGDIVMVRCDVVMTNDISGPMAFRAMEKMGATRVFDPAKVVLVARPLRSGEGHALGRAAEAAPDWSVEQGVTYYEQGRGGIEHTRARRGGLGRPRLGDRRRGLAHVHIRGARRVRHRPRLDRHRRLPRLGSFWQAVPGHDPRRVHRREAAVRHRQGPDPGGDRRDRRRRRDEHGARVRRRRSRLAERRRAARRREHGRRGRSRDRASSRPTTRRRSISTAAPTALDGGAVRP